MSFDSSNLLLSSLNSFLKKEGVSFCLVDEKNYPTKSSLPLIVVGSSSFLNRVLKESPNNLWAVITEGSDLDKNLFVKSLMNQEEKQTTITIKNHDKINAIKFFQEETSKYSLLNRSKESALFAYEELILNAIYDAPPKNCSLQKDFETSCSVNTTNMVFSVKDFYGSIDKSKLIETLSLEFKNKNYTPDSSKLGAGLGLKQSFKKGVSLKFNSKKGEFSEVFIYVSNSNNYKNTLSNSNFIIFNIKEREDKERAS